MATTNAILSFIENSSILGINDEETQKKVGGQSPTKNPNNTNVNNYPITMLFNITNVSIGQDTISKLNNGAIDAGIIDFFI